MDGRKQALRLFCRNRLKEKFFASRKGNGGEVLSDDRKWNDGKKKSLDARSCPSVPRGVFPL
jgi:hypothetical protein